MARAGFTAIHAGRIRFGKDGRWYCDAEPITNAAICRLYARTMRVDADGRAHLELGEDRAEVDVEDTPWVVTAIDGDARHGLQIVLNDGTREPLAVRSLRLSAEQIPYCRAKQGRVETRLLRTAWNELLRHVEVASDGAVLVRSGPDQVALRPGSR